jgi:hypothetical protein
MIRAATLADLARLHELVREMHGRSIYAHLPLAEATMRSILMDGVRRHGGQHAGSTLLNVVEFRGRVEGFMLGILQRLYLICEPLESQDFWLYCSPKAPGIGAARLIDEYVAWAAANPKVQEIKLSWTDALKVDAAKIGRLYTRKGFERVGEIYRRRS